MEDKLREVRTSDKSTTNYTSGHLQEPLCQATNSDHLSPGYNTNAGTGSEIQDNSPGNC